MFSRREAIKVLGGAGSLALGPFANHMRSHADGSPDRLPKRFVFVVRSNGLLTSEIQPAGMERFVRVRGHGGWSTEMRNLSLQRYQLNQGMQPLNAFKDRMTIFQGLSGRMCNGSHSAAYGALGAYRATGSNPPRQETIDGVLAKVYPSIFPHLGFRMDEFGRMVTYPPLSAIAPRRPLPFYADPMLAYRDLFGTVVRERRLQASVAIDNNILDFLASDVRRFQNKLSQNEREKLDHYLNGFEAIGQRQARLARMEGTLRRHAPTVDDRFRSEVETERLKAHFDLAGSALVTGLTQVVTIQTDHLGMRLSGLGLGTKTVHHIGHMVAERRGGGGENFADGTDEFVARRTIMTFHMQQIAGLARKLHAVPEGDGTMLDNTLILYLSDAADRHHCNFYEWPMLAIGNIGGRFRTGRYLQYPGYGAQGHRTISNLYLSILHAAGQPRDRFGDLDRRLPESISQEGPLGEWMVS
ncbi:MAG: DUF1552 domain-containing protein [Gemmataceae bacterium]